ncbi:MAG: hypothetical protein U5O39_14840 [Gammaproteobacteria bacterium]|nr:hypothetical protein [Gammaproteobacteria bacterium]
MGTNQDFDATVASRSTRLIAIARPGIAQAGLDPTILHLTGQEDALTQKLRDEAGRRLAIARFRITDLLEATALITPIRSPTDSASS